MRKLLIVALCFNAMLLTGRFWKELTAVAQFGGGGLASPCAADPTQYSLDANGDSAVDLSDIIFTATWMFNNGPAPKVCLAATDLEARVEALEACGKPIAGFTFVGTNAQGYPEYTQDSSGILFVRLPGGSFNMGSPAGETGHQTNEGPVHTVSLRPFLIAKHEVTQAEYEAVMTGPPVGLLATPSFFTGPQLPVEKVSWDDLHLADGFLERTGLSLPSEAQWEYASRAGTSGPYAGTGNLDEMGWYSSNSGFVTHPFASKLANQFGLHDMHGNVYEWCDDVYKSDFYADDVPGFDPVTLGSGNRVLRGGDFNGIATFCRSANRHNGLPSLRTGDIGFRPAFPLP
jgi:formylglycine-generating enzyme required for sulfatase activity